MIFYQGWGRGVGRREESDPKFPMWVTEWMVFSPNKRMKENEGFWQGLMMKKKNILILGILNQKTFKEEYLYTFIYEVGHFDVEFREEVGVGLNTGSYISH